MGNLKFFISLVFVLSSFKFVYKTKAIEEKKLITCIIQKAGGSCNVSKIVFNDNCTVSIERGCVTEESIDESEIFTFESYDRNDVINVTNADCKNLKDLIEIANKEELKEESREMKDGWLVTIIINGRTNQFYKGLDDSSAVKNIYVKLKQLAQVKI